MKMISSAAWALVLGVAIWLGAPMVDASDGDERPCNSVSNGCSIPEIASPLFDCVEFFRPACDRHDACYLCGKKYGSTRLKCDDLFRLEMVWTCGHSFKGCRSNRRKRRHLRRWGLQDGNGGKRATAKRWEIDFITDSEQEEARNECKSEARDFYNAVRTFGAANYNENAQEPQCVGLEHCIGEIVNTGK